MRIEEARANAKKANVSDRATFELKNLFETDIGKADIVTMYLLPSVNLDLRPKVLSDMWPGTRIVSHAFDMGDWTPDHRESVIGRTVYLWIVPARVEGRWTIEGSHQFTVTSSRNTRRSAAPPRSAASRSRCGTPRSTAPRSASPSTSTECRYRFQGIVNGDRIDGRRNEWRAARAK